MLFNFSRSKIAENSLKNSLKTFRQKGWREGGTSRKMLSGFCHKGHGAGKAIVEPEQKIDETDSLYDYLIHQATGMIMVQAQLTADEAARLLTQFAAQADRPPHRVAQDVIDRRITFG